jgi:hypothetical protein
VRLTSAVALARRRADRGGDDHHCGSRPDKLSRHHSGRGSTGTTRAEATERATPLAPTSNASARPKERRVEPREPARGTDAVTEREERARPAARLSVPIVAWNR